MSGVRHRRCWRGAALVGCLTFALPVQAALQPYLSGAIVYDTDLQISWLADANLAATNQFGTAGILTGGGMSYDVAQTFVANVNAANYLGFNRWRLPTDIAEDVGCSNQNPTVTSGDIGFGCAGGDLGHLFYAELGGIAGQRISTSNDPDLTLFSNIKDAASSQFYWTSTRDLNPSTNPSSFAYYNFSFFDGEKRFDSPGSARFVWLIGDGNIDPTPAIPEPATLALWIAGLGILTIAYHRRSKKTVADTRSA